MKHCTAWHALVKRQRVDRDVPDVERQLVIVVSVLAAADDLNQRRARPAQLEGQPTHVGLATMGRAHVPAFDGAQAPLGLGVAVQLLARAAAIGAAAGAKIIDYLALAVTSETVRGTRFFHD